MEFVNVLDERNRFLGLKTYDTHKVHQVNSHTCSYLSARKTYQELGQTMGLDTDLALYTPIELDEE